MTAAIYIAAPFPMRHDLRWFRDQVVDLGHVITSTWLDVDPDEDDTSWADREQAARLCLKEVAEASVLALVTDDPQSGRGGRHVEYGYALALGREVWVIGPRSHVFTALAAREFTDLAHCLSVLRTGGAS